MFPTPEESQERRRLLKEGLDKIVTQHRQLKEAVEDGTISKDEHKAMLDKIHGELNCPIRNNFNQKHGSMGSGLDGRGERLYTSFPEIILGGLTEIWIYIDDTKVNGDACRNYAEEFRDFIHDVYGKTVAVHIESGSATILAILEKPIVLEATHHGFLIKKCPMAYTHNEKTIPYGSELKRVSTLDSFLTSELRIKQDAADYSTLAIPEIYRLRSWAGKFGQRSILDAIYLHLNARVGSRGVPYPYDQAIAELADVLSATPPEVYIIVDHQITDTPAAEQASQLLASEIHQICGDAVKVSLHSGSVDEEFIRDSHVVLLAMSNGFCVLKARGTAEAGKVIQRHI